MDLRAATLLKLLTQELPLDRVGPQLRYAVKRAVHASDTQRMLLIGRVVVAELIKRGDLLRTAVEGPENPQSAFFLIRNTNKLVDLSILGESGFSFPRQPQTLSHPLPGQQAILEQGPPQMPLPSLNDYAGMLGAMEQAQDLELSSFHTGENCTILAGILKLLGHFTPQFRLFILLNDLEGLTETPPGIFGHPESDPASGWLAMRQVGHSAWLPTAGEFPAPIKESLNQGQAGDRTTDLRAASFKGTCGVAVSLFQPQADAIPESAPQEIGLLFLIAKDDWGRDPMLKLATRFSSFVTSRWQHQTEVNQRINKDGLTGIYNRAYFDNQFTLELERARRSESQLTLVIADLDNFKRVNDKMGHQVGDLVLIMVARRLQEELRRIDHICRIGGEEFALILPDTSQEAALDVMNRLLKAPFTEEVAHQGQVIQLGVTFSFGVVTYPQSGKDAFELYRKADAMLYLSKEQGRSQCHFWDSEGDHIQLTP